MFSIRKKPPTAAEIEKARNIPPEDFLFDDDLNKNLEKYEKYVLKVIHITCLPGDPKQPHKGRRTLHWRMTLELHSPASDKKQSVKYVVVDQAQDEEFQKKWQINDRDFPAHITFESKGYAHSKNAVEKLDIPVVKHVVFSDFFRLIKVKGLDRFRRCPEGHGCLSWLKRCYGFVVLEQWLDAEISTSIQRKLDSYKKNQIVGEYIIPGCQGTFF